MTDLLEAASARNADFDLWAEVYDAQTNPLLALEERVLASLLPENPGHVVDIGCGTGRWLSKLEAYRPHSLLGIDPSLQMLEKARVKVSITTILHHGDALHFPCDDHSQDLLLASFVVSYLDDLDRFASECQRVLQPGATLLISDMHPGTAERRGWKRSFRIDGREISVATNHQPISEIVDIFRRRGFSVDRLLEPSFEVDEEPIFDLAGRLEELISLAGAPAIYILKLRKDSPSHSVGTKTAKHTLRLKNAQIADGPRTWRNGSLDITGSRVESIHQRADEVAASLDLTGYSILPGLTNAHDHLEFGLFPKLGRHSGEEPYSNAAEWAREIQACHRSTIDLYRRIPLHVRLWWGALRNTLCGVTTVCHHNQHYSEFDDPHFPVTVPDHLQWSHSVTFDPLLRETYRAVPFGTPFVLHAAEGIDQQSRSELSLLKSMQVLKANTVLVHGLALTETDIAELNERSVSLVVCPTSNLFLFQQTASTRLLCSVQRLALGSDSSITAAGDFLDEVRYLQAQIGMDGDELYKASVTSAADIFHLPSHTGRVMSDGVADLIAVRPTADTPANVLAKISFENVELVVRGGTVQAVAADLYRQLPKHLTQGLECLEIDGHRRWVHAPLKFLFEAAEEILGAGNLQLGGKSIRYVHAL